MSIPKELGDLLEGMVCIIDNQGKSMAQVNKYYDENKVYYLKIQQVNSEVEREIGLYQWLKGKLPVPSIIYQAIIDDISYLLLEKAEGEILNDEKFINNPELLVRLAAKGISKLQSVDISECIFNSTIDYKLLKAREILENGVTAHFEDNIYTKGMSTFQDIYSYLVENKPEEELVFTHGDYCFNNYFTNGDDITSYIDLGRGGVGDKYQDIALCIRQLRNYDKKYINQFFELLGFEPDYEKIKYYILLDELF